MKMTSALLAVGILFGVALLLVASPASAEWVDGRWVRRAGESENGTAETAKHLQELQRDERRDREELRRQVIEERQRDAEILRAIRERR